MSLGLISDTHGLLRPEALEALAGVEQILHAGDIGRPEILEELAAVAPVAAVRGNNDRAAWAQSLPEITDIRWRGRRLHLLHDVGMLRIGLASVDAVVFGHSHRPSIERRDGVLFVNPGSAGPRRFRLPIAVARLTLRSGRLHADIVELGVTSPGKR